MPQLHPYLSFNGNCREAMTFYKDCLGGELTLQPIQGSPLEAHLPAEAGACILHASLATNGLMLLGSDQVGSGKPVWGNTITLSLTCSTEDEMNRFFAALSAEGQITHPLHAFFGGTLGTLIDQFGINWMLFHEKKKEASLPEKTAF